MEDLSKVLGYQGVNFAAEHMDEMKAIMSHEWKSGHYDPRWVALEIFSLGFLNGIRAERRNRRTHEKPWKLATK